MNFLTKIADAPLTKSRFDLAGEIQGAEDYVYVGSVMLLNGTELDLQFFLPEGADHSEHFPGEEWISGLLIADDLESRMLTQVKTLEMAESLIAPLNGMTREAATEYLDRLFEQYAE